NTMLGRKGRKGRMIDTIKAKLFYKAFQMMSNRTYGPNPLEHPGARQEAFLLTELQRQTATYYGRKYGFETITSVEAFQTQVPLTTFDDYGPYFERIKQGTPDVLFKDTLVAWLLTSGTTSTPKMVPFTDHMAHRLGMAPLCLYLSYIEENPRDHLKCLSGKFLSVVADPEVERLNGLPVGYVSGVALALKAKSKFAASMFTPSLDVLMEKDWDKKYWGISEQVTQQNVSMIAGLPVYIADYLAKLDLDHKYQLGLGDKTIPEIWPNLKLIIWSGAKLEGYASRLDQLVGNQVDFREAYGATEPGLIAYQAGSVPGMVPVLGNNFMEFIPLAEWRAMEAEGGEYQDFEFSVHTFQDVKPSTDYVIALTTVGGMYRYIIGDTVVFQDTAVPRFNWSGRITWYSNIALERMNYGHIEQTMKVLSETLGSSIANFSYATSYQPPHYQFIIEPDRPLALAEDLSTLLDQCLMDINAEYHFCRERNLLRKPQVSLVPPGTYGLLERLTIQEKSNRIGQFKPPRFTDGQMLQLLNSIAVKYR
ncbi:MAG: GH3 auxin-responsive promoter family protein, partial [Candidatus Hermodarchaeota archaeon]